LTTHQASNARRTTVCFRSSPSPAVRTAFCSQTECCCDCPSQPDRCQRRTRWSITNLHGNVCANEHLSITRRAVNGGAKGSGSTLSIKQPANRVFGTRERRRLSRMKHASRPFRSVKHLATSHQSQLRTLATCRDQVFRGASLSDANDEAIPDCRVDVCFGQGRVALHMIPIRRG
jgi:hypothetical protein